MAKITAHGETEVARWKHPETGAEYLLTSGGRVLSKWRKGESWSKLGQFKKATPAGRRLEVLGRRAEAAGMERV